MSQHIDCAEQCDIPDGVQLTEVPRPRHAWSDILNCPNEGCERSFMVKAAHDAGPTVAEAAANDRAYWERKDAGEGP